MLQLWREGKTGLARFEVCASVFGACPMAAAMSTNLAAVEGGFAEPASVVKLLVALKARGIDLQDRMQGWYLAKGAPAVVPKQEGAL